MSLPRRETNKEQRTLNEALERLSAEIDAFEVYPHPHAARLASVADRLAVSLALDFEDRHAIYEAALIHDIGERQMRRDYINRDGTLTQDERIDLARHTVIGEQEALRVGASRAAQLLVRWHHEWWNGTGYPDALRREQIPTGARILRVADTYCALTDNRPHRLAYPRARAVRYLVEHAALEFCPRVVQAFLALDQKLPALQSYEIARPSIDIETLHSTAAPQDFTSSDNDTNEPNAEIVASTDSHLPVETTETVAAVALDTPETEQSVVRLHDEAKETEQIAQDSTRTEEAVSLEVNRNEHMNESPATTETKADIKVDA